MRKMICLLTAALLGSAAPAKVPHESMDAIAHDYVVLALGVKQLEPDWIEAPEVPAELATQAASVKLDSPAIIERAGTLIERLDGLPVPKDRIGAERHEWLRASLVSLRMQLQAKQG